MYEKKWKSKKTDSVWVNCPERHFFFAKEQRWDLNSGILTPGSSLMEIVIANTQLIGFFNGSRNRW